MATSAAHFQVLREIESTHRSMRVASVKASQYKSRTRSQRLVIQQMIAETGVDPRLIYCQTTGAPIGQMLDSEFQLMWSSLSSDMDHESIMDELYGRTVASMRPSPAWNYIRRGTLNRLRVSDPLRVCAFLLGRYFEPHDPAYSRVKRRYEDRIQDGINRIQIFQRLHESQIDLADIREFTLYLLMLDSQFDLSILESVPDFPRTAGEFNPTLIHEYTPTIRAYHELLVARKLKLERQAKLQESWMRDGGNRLTREMATAAFMEVKPESEATKARKEREAVTNTMADVLKALMDTNQPAQGRYPEGPEAAPKKKVLGGFKLGGLKK